MDFEAAAQKLYNQIGYDIWPRLAMVRGSTDTVKLQHQAQNPVARDSFSIKLIQRDSKLYGSESIKSGDEYSTEKWNPVTFAIYAGNVPLIKYLMKK